MLGEELRKARLAKGLTQLQLANRSNLEATHVSNLERDKKSPTLDVLFRLCRALEIAPHKLIARVERAMHRAGETDLRSAREKAAAKRLRIKSKSSAQ